MGFRIARQRVLLIVESIAIFLIMLTLLGVIGIQLFGYFGLVLIGFGIVFILGSTIRKSTLQVPPDAYHVPKHQAPLLYGIIHDLSIRAGLEKEPILYLFPKNIMNAATLDNPDQPIIIVTPPIVNRLTEKEVTGILAHEIAHIQYRDTLFLQLTRTVHLFTGIFARVAWIMLILFIPLFLFSQVHIPLSVVIVMFVAPITSVVLQLAFSRLREYNADLGAVDLTDDPESLASALQKIEKVQSHLMNVLFPFQKRREESSIFKSHPAIEMRVDRLEKLSRNAR